MTEICLVRIVGTHQTPTLHVLVPVIHVRVQCAPIIWDTVQPVPRQRPELGRVLSVCRGHIVARANEQLQHHQLVYVAIASSAYAGEAAAYGAQGARSPADGRREPPERAADHPA